jgi:hypothetical protein
LSLNITKVNSVPHVESGGTAQIRRRMSDFANAINAIIGMAQPATIGFTGTITTAKLTSGGTNGSMTFSNGDLVSEVAAT